MKAPKRYRLENVCPYMGLDATGTGSCTSAVRVRSRCKELQTMVHRSIEQVCVMSTSRVSSI